MARNQEHGTQLVVREDLTVEEISAYVWRGGGGVSLTVRVVY